MINTRTMRYTGKAMEAFKTSDSYKKAHECGFCEEKCTMLNDETDHSSTRAWSHVEYKPPSFAARKSIGIYPLTSSLAPWVHNAMLKFEPDSRVMDLLKPYSEKLHIAFERERKSSSGLHDLDLIETSYQLALAVAATILLAADSCAEKTLNRSLDETHSSVAGGEEEFAPWGLLLTGTDCDPPIIGLFPFYLMMCQAFTFEETSAQEHYIYAALTGIDWAKATGKFSSRLTEFENRVRREIPKLQDSVSGRDRSFWRTAHAYLTAVNSCENSRPFCAPRSAAIPHQIDLDLIIAMRGLDTIGSAFMASDGAAWLDDEGFGSLVGSALPNDVMDLHTDIKTGETRNLLRLLYPGGLDIERAKRLMSTIFSGLLCEMYRGHHRARFLNREDGRIVATSPPYSLCRARHRRVFETLEKYIGENKMFWEWTEEIYQMARHQVTEAGFQEPLVCALKRAGMSDMRLPDSPESSFYDTYYDLIEAKEPLTATRPLGVSENISHIIRELHNLWNIDLRAPNKAQGWGRRFDLASDKLFGDAGRILTESSSKDDDKSRFAIAYGRLCTTLPYVAYHTVAVTIMTDGVI